jgi:hypothetical protein
MSDELQPVLMLARPGVGTDDVMPDYRARVIE